MAVLTPEQERTLARMKVAAANAKLLPEDAQASMAAKTKEPLGMNSKGELFKPEDMVNIFAILDEEIDEEEPLRQAS